MTTAELAGAISGAHALTRRWIDRFGETNQVLSGAGAWPVLAAVLAGADGPAREELEAALGIDRDRAGAALKALSSLLQRTPGLGTALALWTAEQVTVHADYRRGLGEVETGPLPDQAAADAWVRDRTDGVLDACPVTIDARTLLLLIGIVTADGAWQRPFTDGPTRWRDSTIEGLRRTDPTPEAADLIEAGSGVGRGTVSRVRCRTTAGFEVHLLGGPEEMPSGEVLARGIDAVEGAARVRPVTELAAGEGAGMVRSLLLDGAPQQDGSLVIGLPRFSIRAHHDLLADADIVGLAAASDPRRARFPRISDIPLVVQSAAQDAVATFSAQGFRAAAVTAVGMMRSSATMPTTQIRQYTLMHERPFGFLVVEPSSGLVLFAGWVADPTG